MKKIVHFFKAKSLQWQLLKRILLTLLLILTVVEISQYISTENYLYKSREQLLEARMHNVDVHILQSIQSNELVIKYAPLIINSMLDVNISTAIIDENGRFVAEDSRLGGGAAAPELGKEKYMKLLKQSGNLEGYQTAKDSGGHENIVIWRKLGSLDTPSGLVQLSTSAESLEVILHRQLYTYITASIIMLILGGVLVRKILNYTLKPLYNMTSTVERINIGQLNVRLPADNGQMEIDKLSDAFNNMLQRLEVSFQEEEYIKEKMRQFISDASHELRTPLTSIHGFVEVLLRGAAKNEEQLNMSLKSILSESERLTKLVNDLLLLTKLDRHVQVEMREENIKNIVDEMYPQLKILAGERRIQCILKDDVLALVNKDQIKQVIFNLVHNAIQYTDEKAGLISIELNSVNRDKESLAVLEVKDNGSGIVKEDLSEIFDRFFRSESHRSRKRGGYGLGLSIVKSIVDSHGGEITVKSEMGKGTTFSICLKQVKMM